MRLPHTLQWKLNNAKLLLNALNLFKRYIVFLKFLLAQLALFNFHCNVRDSVQAFMA
jgi:hypothetical protein